MRKPRIDDGIVVTVRPENWPVRMIPRVAKLIVPLAILAAFALPAWPQQKTEDLTNKSLEDLMNMQVTSVSKKEQKMSQVAAAVFVITQEDIRRSGATIIPDLLRNEWVKPEVSSYPLHICTRPEVLFSGRAGA